MSGVWVFDSKGVARLIANPTKESFESKEQTPSDSPTAPGARPKVLVYLPENQVITSYVQLDQRLRELGWKRYDVGLQQHLIQYHRSMATRHLISLPASFANFRVTHMYDVVVKNGPYFEVRDLAEQEPLCG